MKKNIKNLRPKRKPVNSSTAPVSPRHKKKLMKSRRTYEIETNIKSLICEICSASFDRRSKLLNHLLRHSDSRPHKCTLCLKAFKSPNYLQRHMEIHREPEELFSCNLCEFKAKSKPYLKIHFIRKHTEEWSFTCERCGKMFKIQGDYTTHMKDHDDDSCICDICGGSYSSKSSLYFHKHYKHRNKIKEFECNICNKYFKNKKNLDTHSELHNTTYVCEHCGMRFKVKYGLTKHLKTHSSEKSYHCGVCGKSFTCLSSQKIHLLKHVGERPYVCDICGQTFTQRSPMMSHRKKHPGSHPPLPPIKISALLGDMTKKIVKK